MPESGETTGVQPELQETGLAPVTSSADVLRGGAWFAASRYIPQFYTLAVSIVAARYLGPDGMGRQSFIAFISLSLTTLLSAPLYVSLMRYVGETIGKGEPAAVRGLLAWAWRIEAAAAALGAGVLILAAALGADPQAAWVLAGAVTAMGILHAVPTAVLFGLQRLRQASVVGLVTGAVGVGVTTGVLALGYGIVGMFAAEAAISTVNLVWTGTLARRSLIRAAPQPARSDLQRRVTRYALASSLGVILSLIVARRSEVLFLDAYSTNEQIAFYSISFAFMTALVQIPYALAASVSPAFATLFGAGEYERMHAGYVRGLRLLLVFSMPVMALGIALGPALLSLLYGQSYNGTGLVLVVLLAVFPLMPLVSLSNALLIGYGRVRAPLAANVLAAVVDVGLAAVLTGPFGAIGAACANVGGVIASGILILLYASRLAAPTDVQPAALFRGAIAAGIAGAAAWSLVYSIGGLAGIIAGGAAALLVFAILAPALRILPSTDAVWLDNIMGDKLGGRVGRYVKLCAAHGRTR